MENIIWKKICKCWQEFEITKDDLDFLDRISPVFNGVKKNIPVPTLCPSCRNARRLVWRNERNIYRRKCDATGKPILSVFSPDKPYKVYEHTVWAWDSWDATEQGRDFDFNRPFFEQFDELLKEVPHQSIFSVNCENSDYAQMINWKDCYLTFVGIWAEDIMYSHWMVNTRSCCDCLRCQDSELLYDCTHCYENCYNLKSCFNCYSTKNSSFCWNLEGSSDCFMSSNCKNKRFVFRWIELDEKTYREKLADEKIWERYEELLEEMKKIMATSIYRMNQNNNAIESDWDFIKNSNNCKNCFEIDSSVDCKDFYDNAGFCKDCRDATYGWQSESCYEVLWADGRHNLFQVLNIIWTNESIYTYASYNCENTFWCASLKNKKYCILNKQYTKEEYEALVPKIIDHMTSTWEWWEFFPMTISTFWYNESAAQDHYPKDKSETMAIWAKWSDFENPKPEVSKIIPSSKLPTTIWEIPDDIVNWAIECENTKKPFRIIRQELDFYRKHDLPIPRLHPDERHKRRLELRNDRIIYDRKCDSCWVDIRTTFAPDRTEKVFCEKCYDFKF